MITNADQFASRGDAWDDRVRLDVGLTHEPRRAYGDRLNEDFYSWDDAPKVERYKRTPAPRPEPRRSCAPDRQAHNRRVRMANARIVL